DDPKTDGLTKESDDEPHSKREELRLRLLGARGPSFDVRADRGSRGGVRQRNRSNQRSLVGRRAPWREPSRPAMGRRRRDIRDGDTNMKRMRLAAAWVMLVAA